MSDYTRLPDAEFDVMRVVWSQPVPISSAQVAALLSPEKHWKPQTVLTLLTRLCKRGYLASEKLRGERFYTPLVTQEAYLTHETSAFVRRFHRDSLTGLMSALYSGKAPEKEELDALEQWLNDNKE
jgi:predicted transcriptional regulator